MSRENSKLHIAKAAKNDEFYTLYPDIQKEINAYLEYDPNVFRDKVVLLPCDDPEWSNFTRFFAQNFEALGLKKLISTSYAIDSKKRNRQLSLFYDIPEYESSSPNFDKVKSNTHGKIFTLYRDINNSGTIDIEDLEWEYLDGDGDFRSSEVKKLRDEADIIVTNPPFSLYSEFIEWLFEKNKKFLIIGNKASITYKGIFPLIMQNKMWVGRTGWSGGMWFITASTTDVDRVVNGVNMKNIASAWFTNLEHGRRHQPLALMTMEDNRRFSRHREIKKIGYLHYDNYDAIDVPYTDAIPSDYEGVMGVPVTFMDKYCPEQFEIAGLAAGNSRACGFYFDVSYTKHPEDRGGCAILNNKRQYSRILIKKIKWKGEDRS